VTFREASSVEACRDGKWNRGRLAIRGQVRQVTCLVIRRLARSRPISSVRGWACRGVVAIASWTASRAAVKEILPGRDQRPMQPGR
jgi:hypothetical protein